MVSQASKLNLITLLIVCIVNIMKIESATYMLQMKIGESGKMIVELQGTNFTLDSDYTLTIRDEDCTKTVSLAPPTKEELKTGSGYRPGSWLCKSWFMPKPDDEAELEEIKDYYALNTL